jgi:hypothetical protein
MLPDGIVWHCACTLTPRACRRSPVIRHTHMLVASLGALTLLALWPAATEAQYRRPYPRPYYGYPLVESASSLRVDFEPEDAEVFVDGYYAGRVDEFDGIFQRLRLEPGGHEITIFHEGYRTVRERLYLRPFGDQTFRGDMERLAPGDVAEPPAPPVADPEPPDPMGPPDPGRRGVDRQRPDRERAPPVRQGTLRLRLQPADAAVSIDDEPWSAPAGQQRIAIELPEGRHTLEVSKAGYVTYREDVLILHEGTLRLDVALKPASR